MVAIRYPPLYAFLQFFSMGGGLIVYFTLIRVPQEVVIEPGAERRFKYLPQANKIAESNENKALQLFSSKLSKDTLCPTNIGPTS